MIIPACEARRVSNKKYKKKRKKILKEEKIKIKNIIEEAVQKGCPSAVFCIHEAVKEELITELDALGYQVQSFFAVGEVYVRWGEE